MSPESVSIFDVHPLPDDLPAFDLGAAWKIQRIATARDVLFDKLGLRHDSQMTRSERSASRFLTRVVRLNLFTRDSAHLEYSANIGRRADSDLRDETLFRSVLGSESQQNPERTLQNRIRRTASD